MISLDNYCKLNSITQVDFIKIDVEGFEMKVLKGAQQIIEAYKPSLFIEVNDANLKAQGDGIEIMFDFLKKGGYSFFNVEDGAKFNEGDKRIYKSTDIYCKIV